MAGVVSIFWSAPTMTAGHLLFAGTATGYILVGIAFEEHGVIQTLGGTDAAYQACVPAPHYGVVRNQDGEARELSQFRDVGLTTCWPASTPVRR